jgi:hypothetical protein
LRSLEDYLATEYRDFFAPQVIFVCLGSLEEVESLLAPLDAVLDAQGFRK